MSKRQSRHFLKSVKDWAKTAYEYLQRPVPDALNDIFFRRFRNDSDPALLKNHPSLLRELREKQSDRPGKESQPIGFAPHQPEDVTEPQKPASSQKQVQPPLETAAEALSDKTARLEEPSEVPPSLSTWRQKKKPDIEPDGGQASDPSTNSKPVKSWHQAGKDQLNRHWEAFKRSREDSSKPSTLNRSASQRIEKTESSMLGLLESPAAMPSTLKRRVRTKHRRAAGNAPPVNASLFDGIKEGLQRIIPGGKSKSTSKKAKPYKSPPTQTPPGTAAAPQASAGGDNRDDRWNDFMKRVRAKKQSPDGGSQHLPADKATPAKKKEKPKKKFQLPLPKWPKKKDKKPASDAPAPFAPSGEGQIPGSEPPKPKKKFSLPKLSLKKKSKPEKEKTAPQKPAAKKEKKPKKSLLSGWFKKKSKTQAEKRLLKMQEEVPQSPEAPPQETTSKKPEEPTSPYDAPTPKPQESPWKPAESEAAPKDAAKPTKDSKDDEPPSTLKESAPKTSPFPGQQIPQESKSETPKPEPEKPAAAEESTPKESASEKPSWQKALEDPEPLKSQEPDKEPAEEEPPSSLKEPLPKPDEKFEKPAPAKEPPQPPEEAKEEPPSTLKKQAQEPAKKYDPKPDEDILEKLRNQSRRSIQQSSKPGKPAEPAQKSDQTADKPQTEQIEKTSAEKAKKKLALKLPKVNLPKLKLPKLPKKKSKDGKEVASLPSSVEEVMKQDPAFRSKAGSKPGWLQKKLPGKKNATSAKKPALFSSKKTPKEKAPKPKKAILSFRQKFAIGLDIGNTHIRWVQLTRGKRRNLIESIGQSPLPYPRVNGVDPLEKQLKAIAKEHHLKGPTVLSLPAQEATFRLLKMPILPGSEMQEAIRWQVEPQLPPHIEYDDLAVDYRIIGEDTELWNARILVATVPKQAVQARLKAVSEAGLKPVALDLDPFANELSLTWKEQLPEQGSQLLVHMGAETASISVAYNGQIIFCRTAQLHGEHLIKTIAEATQANRDQAEQLKNNYGLRYFPGQAPEGQPPADPKAMAVAQTLAIQLDRSLVEFMQAFQNFAGEATHDKIDQFNLALIGGNGAELPGLAQWLKARLSVDVTKMDVLANETVKVAGGGIRTNSELSSQFSIALGLALREIVVPENLNKAKRYNFVPGRKPHAVKPAFGGNRLAGALKPVAAILILCIGFFGLSRGLSQANQAANLRKDIEQTRRLKEQLELQVAQKRGELESQQAQSLAEREHLEARHRRLLRSQQNPVPLSVVLQKLGTYVPSGVWITKLTFNGDSLKISGASKTTTAVSHLMNQLEVSKQFRNTTFSYTQRTEETEEEPRSQSTVSNFTFEISTTPVLSYGQGLSS